MSQGKIRASGINPVSLLPRESLTDPKDPGRVIAYLCTEEGRGYACKEIDIREAGLREAVDLTPFEA